VTNEPFRAISGTERPIIKSPSGLALQHIACDETGSKALFVGKQWLQPGERVFLHTHPVEEVLMFLDGHGEAHVDGQTVPVHRDVTLVIPAGIVHGFENTGDAELQLFVIFPGNVFAQTDFVEEGRR
jgi:quercetin dioxygenase-like cupin family protein